MRQSSFLIACIIRMLQTRNKCISRGKICRRRPKPLRLLAFHARSAPNIAKDKGFRHIAGCTFQQLRVSADPKQVQLLFHLRSRIPQSRQVFHRDFHTARFGCLGNLDFRHNASYATFLIRRLASMFYKLMILRPWLDQTWP